MAEDKKWPWSDSPFEGPSKKSDENAMKQIIFHDAAIQARIELFPLDVDYPIWKARFHPTRVLAEGNFNIVYGTVATAKSQRLIVKERFALIKGEKGFAHDWYNRTLAELGVSNPARVVEIFPHGLKDINTGKIDKKIAAIKTASNQIGADLNVVLIAIKAEMDAEFAILKPDRTTQQTTINKKGITRTTLRVSLDAGLTMQWGDLGLEINKWMNDPNATENIKGMHNLAVIQKTEQKIFNPDLKANEKVDLAKRTLVISSKMRATTTGGDAWIYLSSTEGGTDSTPVKIINGIPLIFTAAMFGITDFGVHCHITVVNQAGVKVSFLLQMY